MMVYDHARRISGGVHLSYDKNTALNRLEWVFY